MRPTPLVALLLALVVAGPARADRVHLRSGRVIEGEVHDDGDAIVVRTGTGIEARLPRDQVLSIEATPRAPSADDRLAALDPADCRAHLRLARDLDAAKDEQGARRVRERILERWPDEPTTRRSLGWVQVDGRWVTRAEWMRGQGLEPADGGRTWVTPDEAARRDEAERIRSAQVELRRLLATTGADVAAVASTVAAKDDAVAVPVLLEHVRDESLPLCLLAIRELGRRKAAGAATRLAEAVIEDPRHSGREAAMAALASVPNEGVSSVFIRGLERENIFQRVHAAAALGGFPGVGAVPALIQVLHESTAGFGRASISVETQRAYIQDFQLTSGGTGQTVAEVADPTVGNSTEGIVLDAKVVQWQRDVVVGALRRITGQDHGQDAGAWERWWRGQGGRP
jgi:hypothetical protein